MGGWCPSGPWLETPYPLKTRDPGADRWIVDVNRDPAEVARLRHRVRELARRRDRAVERVALFPNPVSERQLEAMRFELAELEWRIAELEHASSAR
jgi:hypothetical protein